MNKYYKNPDNKAKESIKAFYNNHGWKENDNNETLDAQSFEDLRECAQSYLIKCRNKIKKFIPVNGKHFLDMASGTIQYPEYLDYSKNFSKRHCVDISQDALEKAKKKIGAHGEYYNNDFFDLDFKDNYFDCILSMHTIYHIDENLQEEAIRRLIRFSKKNSPIIIVYSNPFSIMNLPIVQKIKKYLYLKIIQFDKSVPKLYFHSHPLNWWNRFNDTVKIELHPWRTFSAEHQKFLFPNSSLNH